MLFVDLKKAKLPGECALVRLIDDSSEIDGIQVISHKLKDRGTERQRCEFFEAEIICLGSVPTESFKIGDRILLRPFVGKDLRVNGNLYCRVPYWAVHARLIIDANPI